MVIKCKSQTASNSSIDLSITPTFCSRTTTFACLERYRRPTNDTALPTSQPVGSNLGLLTQPHIRKTPRRQGPSVPPAFGPRRYQIPPDTPDLMHSGTPWVHPTPSRTPPIRTGVPQSSFPSDRLPPKPQQQKQKGSGNNNRPTSDLTKSQEVKRLESILSGLRGLRVDRPLDEKGPDPKGGCFCQGKSCHPPVSIPPRRIQPEILFRSIPLLPHVPPRPFQFVVNRRKKNATSISLYVLPSGRSHFTIPNRKNPPSLELYSRMLHVWTPSLFHQSSILSLSPPTLQNPTALNFPRPLPGTTSAADCTGRDRD